MVNQEILVLHTNIIVVPEQELNNVVEKFLMDFVYSTQWMLLKMVLISGMNVSL